MRLLNSINHFLGRAEGFLVSGFLLTMVGLAFGQVVARNIFSTGLVWADAVVRLLVLWVGFLGACLAAKQGQHLSIDALTKFLSGRPKLLVAILIKLFSIVVCIFLALPAARFVRAEAEVGSKFFGDIPNFAVEMILPITFGLMTFHFVVLLVDDVHALCSGRAGS